MVEKIRNIVILKIFFKKGETKSQIKSNILFFINNKTIIAPHQCHWFIANFTLHMQNNNHDNKGKPFFSFAIFYITIYGFQCVSKIFFGISCTMISKLHLCFKYSILHIQQFFVFLVEVILFRALLTLGKHFLSF